MPTTVTNVSATQPRGKRGCWIAAGVTLLAVMLLGFVGLFIVRGVAAGKVVGVLNKEVGVSPSWQVDIGLFAVPRAVLGMPVDVSIAGTDVQLRGKPQAKSFKVDAEGLVVSASQQKLVKAGRVALDATFGEQSVVQFVRQQTWSSRAFRDIGVQFGVGEIIVTGTAENAMLESLAGIHEVAVTAHARPEIRPPSTIALMVQNVEMRGAGGPINLPTSVVSGLIATDLSLDMQKIVPGLQLSHVDIIDSGLRIQGTINVEALLKSSGKGGGNNPRLPDPVPGKSVQS